jgi:hypothetical protein
VSLPTRLLRAVTRWALVAAFAWPVRPASAQPVWVRRVSEYDLGGWRDLTFAGATARYQILLVADRAASTAGELVEVPFETRLGARDHFWQGDGTYVSVDHVSVVSPTLTTADLVLASTDPRLNPGVYPGTARLGYVTDVVDDAPGAFATSWITRGVVDSRWALTFSGGGNGFIDGRRFDVILDVPGDWTDPAFYDLLGVNIGWTVEAPVLLSTGFTRYRAFTTSYAGDTDAPGGNPNLTIRFWGATVSTTAPEPGTLALLLGGCACLALGRRARRAA